MLRPVAKDDVLSQLEPLTRAYYDEFSQCTSCGKIYWSGSHFGRLRDRIADIESQLRTSACPAAE